MSTATAPVDDLVRPYLMTAGRTRPANASLAVESMAVRRHEADVTALRFEPADIADLCTEPLSVAEVAARLDLPLGVARVLVADLEADGVLSVRQPTAGVRGDLDILTRLIQRVSEL